MAGHATLPVRLNSLDVFRGLTIAGMILVNTPGDAKTTYPQLLHASWNGCTPADWVFPWFLLIVGVAMTFSFDQRRAKGDGDRDLVRHVLRRGLVIFALGVLYSNFPFTEFDWRTFRIPGVLQRIALCYVAASLIYLKTGAASRALVSAALLLGYWAAMTLIPVPGYGAGELSQAHKDGNLGAFIDRCLVGGHLSGKTWDATGLFGFWPATVTTLAGTLVGNVLGSRRGPAATVGILSIGGMAMTLVGWLWGGCPDFVGFAMLGEPAMPGVAFPINKPLWTSSFVLFTTGLGCIALAGCYLLVDVLGLAAWSLPFRVFGLNPLLAFMGAGMLNAAMRKVKLPNGSTPHETIYDAVFAPLADPFVASLLYALTSMLLWLGIMGILYRRKIVVKI